MFRTMRSWSRLFALACAVLVVTVLAVRAGTDTPEVPKRTLTSGPDTTIAPLARTQEARSLLDPTHSGKVTDKEVECVAATVVDNPAREQIASNLGRIQNKDLQQIILAAYLGCAYNFLLDTYMAYAPSDLTADQRACVRASYTKLDLQRFAEVIVVDPDAAQTGPLVIKSCKGEGTGDPFSVVAPTTLTTTTTTTTTTVSPPASATR